MAEIAAVLATTTVTFLLAAVSVSLWTLRVAVTSAGRRAAGAAVAGVEAVVFTLAFGRIVANLDDPLGLVAYGAGVCTGTLLGLLLDQRFSAGQSWVRVIVEGDGVALAEALMRRGWPVTTLPGHGPAGPVAELLLGVDDAALPGLVHDLDTVAPEAFRTVERLHHASAPHPLDGLRQMAQPRRRLGSARWPGRRQPQLHLRSRGRGLDDRAAAVAVQAPLD